MNKLIKVATSVVLIMVAFCAMSFTDNHEYVDLGLPSGTLWATCNVGSTTPEGVGGYFAWGETEPKTMYNLGTYKYCVGGKMTKYCNEASYGYEGYTDTLEYLLPMDDAATANWGSDWCTPTLEQWQELAEYTESSWTTRDGVKGRLFTAGNGNSIFLPAAGYYWDDARESVDELGCYMSNCLMFENSSGMRLYRFDEKGRYVFNFARFTGYTVRPVRTDKK